MEETGRLATQDQRPDLGPHGWVADAFWELCTARPHGVGPVPIPAPVIWTYADRYACPPWFEAVIRAVDQAWQARRRAAAEGANHGR